MWNAGLDEAQAGIKIVGKNIHNLRYTDDNTLMAQSEEELNSLLIKYSTPGLSIHHQLLEFTQTHVHWVSDAI